MTSAAPTRRILFVDDDPQLLAGLGKAMRRHRARWTMVFASSGQAALEEVVRATFDVVVSDMRMPVMDGATLLGRIREHDPTTIRMILSGFADRAAIARARSVAQQFFDKPCDLNELSRAIDRACELRAVFSGDPFCAVVARLGSPPSAPSLHRELATLAGQADAGIKAIVDVVERDAALHARVLEVLGAGLAPPGCPIRTLGEAVTRVGIDLVVGIVLAAHAFELAAERAAPELSIAALWSHSLAIAGAARALAAPEAADDAFLAGLVHDVGRILIATELPDDHAAIARRHHAQGGSRTEAERAVLGTTHAELGAYALAIWGLGLPVVDAIARHGDPTEASTPVLAALRVAHVRSRGGLPAPSGPAEPGHSPRRALPAR
jgi:HD-like signal output (HDOD) protein